MEVASTICGHNLQILLSSYRYEHLKKNKEYYYSLQIARI